MPRPRATNTALHVTPGDPRPRPRPPRADCLGFPLRWHLATTFGVLTLLVIVLATGFQTAARDEVDDCSFAYRCVREYQLYGFPLSRQWIGPSSRQDYRDRQQIEAEEAFLRHVQGIVDIHGRNHWVNIGYDLSESIGQALEYGYNHHQLNAQQSETLHGLIRDYYGRVASTIPQDDYDPKLLNRIRIWVHDLEKTASPAAVEHG